MRFFRKPTSETPPPEPVMARPQPADILVEMRRQTSMPLEPRISHPIAPISAEPMDGATRPERQRPGPARTRLIGFDTSDGRVNLFDDERKVPPAKTMFEPVGWLVVVDGPGRGHAFALRTGLSTLGRGEDQTVTLDFGDQTISRSNHAAIVYEPETHQFLLGHGGKANIVRLNGKPLLSTEELHDRSTIQIGETTLRFVAFCSPEFNWSNTQSKDDADVAFI